MIGYYVHFDMLDIAKYDDFDADNFIDTIQIFKKFSDAKKSLLHELKCEIKEAEQKLDDAQCNYKKASQLKLVDIDDFTED